MNLFYPLFCIFVTANSQFLTTDRNLQEIGYLEVGKTISFEASNFPGHYLRHANFRLILSRNNESVLFKLDATFTVRLATNGRQGFYSFESVNYPGRYIAHGDFWLYMHPNEDSQAFRDNTSFRIVQPTNGRAGFVSIEASNFPNFFWRHENGLTKIVARQDSQLYKDDSTFKIVSALSVSPDPNPPVITKPEVGKLISFVSSNYNGYYLRHASFQAWINPFIEQELYRKDATFKVVPALNNRDGYFSFESVNYPGFFLKHTNVLIFISKFEGTLNFKEESSFQLVPALDGRANCYSILSSNVCGHYLRHAGYKLWLHPFNDQPLYKHDASWLIVEGLYKPEKPQEEQRDLNIRGLIIDTSTGLPRTDLVEPSLTFTNSYGKVYRAVITNGAYQITLPNGEYDRKFTCEGYITLDSPVNLEQDLQESVTASRIYISKHVNGYKVVLTWNSNDDLDLFVRNGDEFVVYANRKNQKGDIRLDVDDRDGHGPETIVLDRGSGLSRVVVSKYNGGIFVDSKATIQIFHGDKLDMTLEIPPETGRYWLVADIDADAQKINLL